MNIFEHGSISDNIYDRIDACILVALWSLVLVASVQNLGYIGASIFFAFSCVLIVRNTINGIMVLLLIQYSPAITVGLPNIFAVTCGMLTLKLLLIDFPAGRIKMHLNSIQFLGLTYIIYAGLTTILAPDTDLAFHYYWKYVEGLILILLFYAAISSSKDLGNVFMWWAVFAGLSSIIKIIHIHLGEETYLYTIMKTAFAKDIFDVDHRTHIMIGGATGRRFILPGEEPNYISASLIFPFSIALSYFNVSKPIHKLLWLFVSCLILVGLVGTYSRSGFIVAAVVIFLYFLRNKPFHGIIFSLIFIGGLVLAVEVIPAFHNRIFGIGEAVEKGATGRFQLWGLALNMWLESPLYGNGMAAFYSKYKAAVHNTYLQNIAETGLIGLVIFLSVPCVSIISGLQFRRLARAHGDRSDYQFSTGLLFGLIGFSAIISTVTFQDIKFFWLACAGFAALSTVSNRTFGDKLASRVYINR